MVAHARRPNSRHSRYLGGIPPSRCGARVRRGAHRSALAAKPRTPAARCGRSRGAVARRTGDRGGMPGRCRSCGSRKCELRCRRCRSRRGFCGAYAARAAACERARDDAPAYWVDGAAVNACESAATALATAAANTAADAAPLGWPCRGEGIGDHKSAAHAAAWRPAHSRARINLCATIARRVVHALAVAALRSERLEGAERAREGES